MLPLMQDIDIADLRRISELIYERYHCDFRNYANRFIAANNGEKIYKKNRITGATKGHALVCKYSDRKIVNGVH